MKLLIVAFLGVLANGENVNCFLSATNHRNSCNIPCRSDCKLRVSGNWGNRGASGHNNVHGPYDGSNNESYGGMWMGLSVLTGSDCRGSGSNDWRGGCKGWTNINQYVQGGTNGRQNQDLTLNCQGRTTLTLGITDTDWGDNEGGAQLTASCPDPEVWGAYGAYGACQADSGDCGTGTQTRTRTCTQGGAACASPSQATTESQACDAGSCVDPDCGWIDANGASVNTGIAMAANGLQCQDREFCDGKNCCRCKGGRYRCPSDYPHMCQDAMGAFAKPDYHICAQMCMGPFGKPRSCANGFEPHAGGEYDPDSAECNPPVDCKQGKWQEGTCNATCGDGEQTNTRETTTAAAHGGKECGDSEETAACNLGDCVVLGCTDGNATNFNIDANEDDGSCEYEWLAWGEFDDCSQSCRETMDDAAGTQIRTRECSSGDQDDCGDDFSETQECGTDVCPCNEGAALTLVDPTTVEIETTVPSDCESFCMEDGECVWWSMSGADCSVASEKTDDPPVPDEQAASGAGGCGASEEPLIPEPTVAPVETPAPTPSPTEAPTCMECSVYHGDKKGCIKTAPKSGAMCGDCTWDKKQNRCEVMTCGSFTFMGPFKCSKNGKKFTDVVGECFWDLETKTCGPTLNTNVGCGEKGYGQSKKMCKKLGKPYIECKFEKNSKTCMGKDDVLTCGHYPAVKKKCNADVRKPKGGCQIEGAPGSGEKTCTPMP